jgi:hypothetical protein
MTNLSTKDYYQSPSPIGKPILDMFLDDTEYKEDCIQTIWSLEERGIKFNMLNVIKYLWRLGVKNPDYRNDLEKVIVYIEWEIAAVKKNIDDLRNDIETPKLPVSTVNKARIAIAMAESIIESYDRIISHCKLVIESYAEI